MTEQPKPSAAKSLTRAELEAVIRRAVELSLEDTSNPKDGIAEDEVIRIAAELGIDSRHVKQALLERPAVEEEPPGYLAQSFGPATIVAQRVVPCPQSVANRRLEDYLVTSEYLQLRRKQGDHAFFEPADDAFSSIARSFSRPSSRFHLARSEKAYLSVHPIDDKSCHVRIELSFNNKRQEQVQGSVALAAVTGILAGAGGAALGGFALLPVGDTAWIAGALIGGGTASAGMVTLMVRYMRREYRKWLNRTREEAEALIDRLEQGETLQPPASPWLRRLQNKLRGS